MSPAESLAIEVSTDVVTENDVDRIVVVLRIENRASIVLGPDEAREVAAALVAAADTIRPQVATAFECVNPRHERPCELRDYACGRSGGTTTNGQEINA